MKGPEMKLMLMRTQEVIVENLKVAKSPFSRIRGLLFTDSWPPRHGLWLVPCNSIHSLGMRYAIDVIYLNKACQVVKITPNFRRNRLGPIVRKAHSVVELPAGSLEKMDLKVDDILQLS
jgi:uncharacterized protein